MKCAHDWIHQASIAYSADEVHDLQVCRLCGASREALPFPIVSLVVQGLPGDDFPLNGLRGWGLGSKVRFNLNGVSVLGLAVGASCTRGDMDPTKPESWSVDVTRKGFRISIPFEDLEPA